MEAVSQNKLALVGTVVILILILAAILAPVLAQNDPYVSLKNSSGTVMTDMSPSESGTILGTDSLDGMSSAAWYTRRESP